MEVISPSGIIQRVEAPKEEDQRDALRRVNDLLCRQNFVSQSLLRFLRDEAVESCITDILRDILNLYNGKVVFIFLNTTKFMPIIVVSADCF